jgi:hypothetical protein
MAQAVTIHIPDRLYDQLKRIAEPSHRFIATLNRLTLGPAMGRNGGVLLLRLLPMKQASALDEKDTGEEGTPGV